MESAFRKAVQKATSKAIPRGRHHQETPLVSKDVRSLITDRDRCKDSIEISALNNRIQQLLFKEKQEKWNTFIEENKQLTSGKLWAAMAKMTGKRLRKKNCVIKFDGKEPKNSRDVANQFNKSFARACPVIRTNQNRCNKKAVRKLKQEDFVVTTPMVDEAIKEANNSKALGPDNISTLHLKKSGPLARSYIAALATLSFSTGRIPGIWKRAIVIPLLKPGKKPEEAASYRPVSLLSPIARIIERIALPEIRKCVDLPSIQHGFRKGHSTTSALCNVSESVRCGLNKKRPPQRTVIVALDLKRAFDTVNHEILHKKILQSSLPGFLKIWLYG